MSKIVVGCNILTQIDALVYPNHCQMWYQFGRNLTDYNFLFYAPRRVSIDNMRNATIDFAIKNGAEFVFFYDDDVIVPVNALYKLIQLLDKDENIAVASGLTYIRKYPFDPMLFKKTGDGLENYTNFKEHIGKDGILEKDLGAVGFSCVLLRTSFLELLNPPYCITGSRNTEDVYLCHRITDHFPDAKIVCDTTIDTSHLVERYWINDANRDNIRKYEEVLNGAKEAKKDRGSEYAQEIQKSIKSRVRRQPHQTKGIKHKESGRNTR